MTAAVLSEIMDLADAYAKAYYMGRGEDARKTLQAAIAEGIAAEREACATLCDQQHDRARTSPGAARADSCARAIRARGTP